ncbi:Radical SAM core domain-containing protein [Entamoeba marina]
MATPTRTENTDECLHRKLDNSVVQCLACSRYCVIKPGETGVCSVRKNENGELRMIVYGKAVSPGPSPVEKKPLYHFLPGTMTYSLATVGCNFMCKFCQNYDLSQCAREIKKQGGNYPGKISKYGYEISPQEIVDNAIKHHCPAIAYTYNEPTIFLEYALDCARIAQKHGIKNIFVSNGYQSPEAVQAMKGLIDAINIDLKAFTDKFYTDLTLAHLQPVLNSIRLCHEAGIWVEVTTLVIPGQNDSTEELTNIANFCAFHPDYLMLDTPPTPLSTLRRAYDIGKKAGLNYVYTGNVIDPEHEATYCKQCNELLIQRSVFNPTMTESFVNGKCMKCGTLCDGVWE